MAKIEGKMAKISSVSRAPSGANITLPFVFRAPSGANIALGGVKVTPSGVNLTPISGVKVAPIDNKYKRT